MYAAIDMMNLKVMHVHSDFLLLGELLYLEGAKSGNVARVNTTSPMFLVTLSENEIDQLHLNITGENVDGDLRTKREVIAQLIEGMKPSRVDSDEIARQIESVADKLEGPMDECPQYHYVRGARTPRVSGDGELFPLTGKPLSVNAVKAAAQRSQHSRSEPAPRAVPRAAKPATAPAQARRPAGSTKAVVWSVADQVWEKEGKPTNKDEVLELRKRMMVLLEEEHGIKRTSSSTSLGEWMKDRVK